VLWAHGCHPLLLRVGQSLDQARLVGSAVEYWRDLAARCDTKLVPGHADSLVVAAQLAAAYLAAGRAGEAVLWNQRVLAERSRELAPGHPAVAAARIGLARALIMAVRPDGCRPHCGYRSSAARIRSGSLGPITWTPWPVWPTCAHLYYEAGRIGDAEALLRRTAAYCERVLPHGHPLTRAVRQSLANIGES
jgi:Tetratricopeptide repeat